MARYSLFLLALAPLLFSSCVGKKKFLQTQYLQEQCERRERQIQSQLDFARAQIDQLQGRAEELSNEIGHLRNDKEELEDDTLRLQNRLRDMARRAQSTQQELGAELESRTQELEEKRERLRRIEERVDRRDQRLKEAFAALRDTLRTLPESDAAVALRDGQVFVTLSDQLLFGGRSTTVAKPGERALGLIAAVLNRYPDLDVIAMGHTSTDRPSRGYDDNWDLSVRRAATVVRLLTSEFDVNSNQITAAGKGEYLPLAPNNSSENKLKNRRLELVLAPRIDLLYNLLRETP